MFHHRDEDELLVRGDLDLHLGDGLETAGVAGYLVGSIGDGRAGAAAQAAGEPHRGGGAGSQAGDLPGDFAAARIIRAAAGVGNGSRQRVDHLEIGARQVAGVFDRQGVVDRGAGDASAVIRF